MDLRTERPDLRPERPDLGSERPDLRSERPDLRPDRPDGGDEWMDGGTDEPKSPCVLQDFVPFGAAALLPLTPIHNHSKQGNGYR